MSRIAKEHFLQRNVCKIEQRNRVIVFKQYPARRAIFHVHFADFQSGTQIGKFAECIDDLPFIQIAIVFFLYFAKSFAARTDVEAQNVLWTNHLHKAKISV